MESVPETPDPQTRTAVTQRIIAHVTRGWPRLGEPIVHHRGQFCYVAVLLPGHREPTPILRLRYQGSADRWAIGIYLASSGQYTESELPASFGPKTGTPEQGVDDTFILYAGPRTGHLRPSARTRGPRPRKCETRGVIIVSFSDLIGGDDHPCITRYGLLIRRCVLCSSRWAFPAWPRG
jgi:hypothetical protein